MAEREDLEPRREPIQERSQALVDAIVEAGLRILENEGLAQLTTTRIAEVAGVSVGSLYRYFPNKQAIVARVLDALVVAEQRATLDEETIVRDLSSVPAEEALRTIVLFNIDYHRRQLALGDDFYREHHRDFSLGAKMGHEQGLRVIRGVLEAHRDSLEIPNLDIAAFMLARGASALVRIAVEERPDLIESDEFAEELIRVFTAYFGAPAAPPDPNDG